MMASMLEIFIAVTCLIGSGLGAISPFISGGGGEVKDNSVTQPPWAPATKQREFSYNIQDGILGANQVRHEVWKNGTMSGMYAYPLANHQWQVVDYIADKDGFRVTESKVVSEEELMGGHEVGSQTAAVDIDKDGEKTSYTVKASDLKQKKKQQEKLQPNLEGPCRMTWTTMIMITGKKVKCSEKIRGWIRRQGPKLWRRRYEKSTMGEHVKHVLNENPLLHLKRVPASTV